MTTQQQQHAEAPRAEAPDAEALSQSVGTRLRSAGVSLRPQRAGVVYALILLVVILVITTIAMGQPAYLSSTNISNILGQVAPDAIIAVFMTVVLISGNFDLSVASVAALSAAIALETIDTIGTVPAILLALLVGAVVGFVNAILVQKVGVNAFIVTLGAMTAVRGVVLIVLNGESITAKSQALVTIDDVVLSFPFWVGALVGIGLLAIAVFRFRQARRSTALPLDGFFVALIISGVLLLVVSFTAPDLLTQPLPVWLMVFVTVGVSLGLRFLVPGRKLYAVGSNPEAARLSGINVNFYKMAPFVLSGLAAAAVGVIYAGRFDSVDPNALTGTELTVIAAAILGGTSLFGGAGYVGKSVLGTVILFTLSNGFNMLNLGSNYQYVVQGVVLVAASAVYTVASRSRRRRKVAEAAPPASTPSSTPTLTSAPTPTEAVAPGRV
ncbi:MAG: ribose transport system permease protein [Actinomycetota bacterium]|jgi:D-xylose transport system permease protein|nr:ribose transport system permease protein [Actinomycetota bacterium]